MQSLQEDLDLDTSWIQEQERIHQLSQNCFREPLPYIHTVYLYINENNVLESVRKEKVLFGSGSSFGSIFGSSSILTKEELSQLIHTKEKTTPSTKYVFKEIGIFQIPLEPEQIPAFSRANPTEYSFFRILGIEDIILQPSIFIFHPYQTIYFIFHEIKSKQREIKSILAGKEKRITKRVKILVPRKTRHHY